MQGCLPLVYIPCLCLMFLCFVTWHHSPTSLRYWSVLGSLVIMLMPLCSIKVSAPSFPPHLLPTVTNQHLNLLAWQPITQYTIQQAILIYTIYFDFISTYYEVHDHTSHLPKQSLHSASLL